MTVTDARAALNRASAEAQKLAQDTARANSIAMGLRDLAAFIQANPHLMDHIRWALTELSLPVVFDHSHALDLFADAAREMRNRTSVYSRDDDHAGLRVHFGTEVTLRVYGRRTALNGHPLAATTSQQDGRPLNTLGGEA